MKGGPIVAVRDARAQNRYEPTLLRWTPAGAGLNEDDVEELEGALLERVGRATRGKTESGDPGRVTSLRMRVARSSCSRNQQSNPSPNWRLRLP